MILPKSSETHLTLHSRLSGSRWVIIPLWLSGSGGSFVYSSSMYSCHLFLRSSASLGPYHFCPLLCSCFMECPLVFSICFPYFFALIPEEGFLISPCYSLELCTQMFASFLSSFAFRYSSFSAVCKADNHFAILHAFFLGMVLITDSCTMSWISVHRSVKGVFVHLSEICKKEKGQTSILNSEMVILRSPFK